MPPLIQYGVERKLPFVDALSDVPTRTTEDEVATLAFLADVVSWQYPDHDPERWPLSDEAIMR